MKKNLFFIFLMQFFIGFSQKDANYDKINALKVAHITQKVGLTSAEAKSFWVVYDDFSLKIHQLHEQSKQNRQKCFEKKEISESEALEIVKKDEELNEKIHQISKEKDKELLKIISAKKFLRLKEAEKEFYKKLMTHYKKEK